jgi:methylmalonyl-CoA mutase cobalamin-binding subunit
MAHQGPPKSAQKAKVMADAFKLVWVERRLFPGGARKIVALADPSAAGHFTDRTWMAAALRDLGIEVLVVELPTDIRAGIRAAQARQVR